MAIFKKKKLRDHRVPSVEEFEDGFKFQIKYCGEWHERTFKKEDSIHEIKYYLKSGDIKVYVE